MESRPQRMAASAQPVRYPVRRKTAIGDLNQNAHHTLTHNIWTPLLTGHFGADGAGIDYRRPDVRWIAAGFGVFGSVRRFVRHLGRYADRVLP